MSSRRRRAAAAAKYSENTVRLRMIIAFVIVIILFLGIAFRLGWVQVIASDKYATLAKQNQTTDEIIPAKRGNIIDRNGKDLGVSTTSYKVWVRLKPAGKNKEVDEKTQAEQLEKTTKLLSDSLKIKKSKLKKEYESEAPRVKVAKNITKDKVDYIEAGAEANKISIIEIEEDSSRNYPLNSFAAHLIGSVSEDNNGQSGLELQYNKYLSGVAGRWIKNTDRSGNPIPGGEEIKYEEEDGLNVVLTLDETIQYYVEKEIQKAYKEQSAAKVSCIVMDPKTGDVLAMSSVPTFDLNDPSNPTDKEAQKKLAKLSDKKKTDYLNSMWRNPLVSDLYEPGSVFKLVTVGSALEEGTVTPNSGVHCSGSYNVAGETIKCHIHPGAHGGQTVTRAVGNSCNPAMMQIIQKMGHEKFYKYMELFGMTNKTEIDFPGEASPLLQNEKDAGPVGLATMSFGHGLSITPLQMISGASVYGNDGKLMKPRLVKELTDSSGKTIKEFPTKVVRQVVSKKTSKEMQKIMEAALKDSSNPVIDVPGYRIGAKTGTANKIVNNQYREGVFVGSVLAMAPIDDPKFTVLVVVDEPKAGPTGGLTAGPAAESICEEILRYLNVQPSYNSNEKAKLQKNQVTVPKVTGLKYKEAAKTLDAAGLKVSLPDGETDKKNFSVVDQYPKPGSYTKKGSTVFLYKQ